MVKKLVVAFAILAIALAFAGTPPTAPTSFRITLRQQAVVNGTELPPGDYQLTIGKNKITLVQGKVTVKAPAKIETVEKQFAYTGIMYTPSGDKQIVSVIEPGGSNLKIVLKP